MHAIVDLCLETAWTLRFEVILLLVCALVPQVVLPWYRQRREQQQHQHQQPPLQRQRLPKLRQHTLQSQPGARGCDWALDDQPEGKLERKYDSRQDGRLQVAFPSSGSGCGGGRGRALHGSSSSHRPRAGAGSEGGAGPGGAGSGMGAGGEQGHHLRVMARQAARMILTESCRERGRPLEMHQDAIAGGACFEWLPEAEAHRLYLALGLAALRGDGGDSAVQLLQDMRRHGIPVPPSLLALVVKRCAARRIFRKALAAYDIVAAGGKAGQPLSVNDPEFWGTLLLSAVETGKHARCDSFWTSLKAIGTPTSQDYTCKIRAASARGLWEEAVCLVKSMRAEGMPLDPTACNAAVSACVTAQQLQAGMRILDLIEQDEGRCGKDVAPYNTMMKGFAFSDDLEEVLRLHERMQERGVEATQVTFGILLDACVSRGDLENAAAVFQDMITRGCPMNTVLYTTLIKGLARAGRVDKAMEVYTHMREQSSVNPDTILFSVLIKANCDSGRIACALQLFETMIELGYQPDEIVFNNLLVGCSRDSNLALGKRLLGEMKRLSVQPSHATASILIKLYAKCHVLEEAQYLLANLTEELGVEPEPRLFVQLVHASVREREGSRTLEVFHMMLKVAPPDATTTGSIISTCFHFDMLDTAVEVHNAAVAAGCAVQAKDTQALQQAMDQQAAYQRPAQQTPGEAGLLGKRRCYCGP